MGSCKSITKVKTTIQFKMSQPTTTYRKVPTGSVTLRVPKLIGSKWVYEYPVSASTPKSSNNSNSNSRNFPREIPIEVEKSAKNNYQKDWRGPWPHDSLGLKPRLVGGKLIKPKFTNY